VQTLVHPTWVALVASFGIRQQRSYQLQKKSFTLTAVYNAVEQISNDIAKYSFSVNQKTATTANQNPIIQHTSLFLFLSPNSLMTTFIFCKQWLFLLLLRGNVGRIVYDASGNPIETIFINWDKVTDIRINKGELLYYVPYKSIISIWVLHFKNFTRRNRRRGRNNNLWRTAIRD
jgi:HK97 family phage portal protein